MFRVRCLLDMRVIVLVIGLYLDLDVAHRLLLDMASSALGALEQDSRSISFLLETGKRLNAGADHNPPTMPKHFNLASKLAIDWRGVSEAWVDRVGRGCVVVVVVLSEVTRAFHWARGQGALDVSDVGV